MKHVAYCGNLCTGIEDRDLGILINKLKEYAYRSGMEGNLNYRWFQSARDLIKVKIRNDKPSWHCDYRELEFNCHEVETHDDVKKSQVIPFILGLLVGEVVASTIWRIFL